jgi:hypothetical protein
MGIVPPRLILPPGYEKMQVKNAMQVKEEHPCQTEWDEIRERAEEQGAQALPDGTWTFPPQGGSVI